MEQSARLTFYEHIEAAPLAARGFFGRRRHARDGDPRSI